MTQILQMTRRYYECMAAVQELTSEGWPARVKDVASRLNVRPPTALEFLLKLTESGIVKKGPTGYRLTEEGEQVLRRATRTHRLLERLLTNAGVPLDEACRISFAAGSEIDYRTAELLCSHLSHPDTCPHGQPIPAGDEFD